MRRLFLSISMILMLANSASAEDVRADKFLNDCSGSSDKAWCSSMQEQFKEALPEAYAGDYMSQRNVALCMSTGCDGAVRPNRITGCAWRMVIIASGDPEMDQSDTLNLRTFCGSLDAADRVAAQAQAENMIKKIKAR